jgi:GH18 family chitinase
MFYSNSFLFLFLSQFIVVLAEAGSILIQQQQQGQQQQQHVVAIQSAPLVMAYYPDWVASDFPPERIDFTRFDWIDFAFAIPDSNYALSWDDPDNSPVLLYRLVAAAHGSGKPVKLSIGGWSGSK